jgi:GTP-binding protein
MRINSAVFVKSVTGSDPILEDEIPQIVFIGRSNAGKSSVINSITGKKGLARTSSTPGRTQLINLFLINNAFYLIDLPGYGFAKMPIAHRHKMRQMVSWFLFNDEHNFHKVVLIIDAKVGLTADDLEMLSNLQNEDLIIVANKIDKLKKSEYAKQMKKIKETCQPFKVVPFSTEKKSGISELVEALLK